MFNREVEELLLLHWIPGVCSTQIGKSRVCCGECSMLMVLSTLGNGVCSTLTCGFCSILSFVFGMIFNCFIFGSSSNFLNRLGASTEYTRCNRIYIFHGWLDELELYALINLIQSLLKICSEGTLLLDHALQEEFRHSIFYVNRQSRSSHYYNHRDIYNGLW